MEKKDKHLMTLRTDSLNHPYLPVAWEYREVIEEEIKKIPAAKFFTSARMKGSVKLRGALFTWKRKKMQGFSSLSIPEAK